MVVVVVGVVVALIAIVILLDLQLEPEKHMRLRRLREELSLLSLLQSYDVRLDESDERRSEHRGRRQRRHRRWRHNCTQMCFSDHCLSGECNPEQRRRMTPNAKSFKFENMFEPRPQEQRWSNKQTQTTCANISPLTPDQRQTSTSNNQPSCAPAASLAPNSNPISRLFVAIVFVCILTSGK